MSISAQIAHFLGDKLDWEVRQNFERAYKAMWRELEYLLQRQKPPIRRVIASGWSCERLRTISVLSAFARTVLGPLASAKGRRSGYHLGLTRPILYGRFVTVSSGANKSVQDALDDFESLCRQIGLKQFWLHANRMTDIVYHINKYEDGKGPG